MESVKKIARIKVIKAGSPPDVDSDFATYCRDDVLAHVESVNGRGTLSNIVTFSTLAAKGAFKTMCTIYEIPFADANKIAAMVPTAIEGVECTIDDIFNPSSDRYAEASEFRAATSEEKWKKIIDGARAIEGRMKSTGVHPCGVVMSNQPISDIVPLQIRQDDQRVIAQWKYPELEALGLIKFDFLGLDTVDLIQHTVEYIMANGKTPPNMNKIIHGPMDDKKTYDLLGRGETIGVFQLAGTGVQDLLKRMKPTDLSDIAATTALYRPGPMGMKSHVKYADRKTGREKLDYPIHPEFKGSPLEELLSETYYLVVYQEQIIQIANKISGMTLQEGDDLRSAMGKKKLAKMMQIKPKFVEGGMNKGYSEEAMNILWDTCYEFAKYGFNLAHSVSYAITAYQSAYLKANYPVEFMAALIAQNVDNKAKILEFLQETSRMKLKVGAADINLSNINVAPDYSKKSGFDIVYGLSGIIAISKTMAKIIVDERTQNGEYSSVQDVVNRCSPLGVTNKKIYENLTYAGAFDTFGYTRKSIIESLPDLLGDSKVQQAKGSSLFDMMGETSAITATELSKIDEYNHLEKLKYESDVIGLYLTSHPLSNIGNLSGMRSSSFGKLLTSKEKSMVKVLGSLTSVKVSRKRGAKSILVTLDDGTGFIQAHLNKNLVQGLEKTSAQKKIKQMYIDGESELPRELEENLILNDFPAVDDLEEGSVYSVEMLFRPGFDDNPYSARIGKMTKIDLANDGSLPIRVRLPEPKNKDQQAEQVKLLKEASKLHPGRFPISVAYTPTKIEDLIIKTTESVYLDAVDAIKAGADVLTKGTREAATEMSLMGEVQKTGKRKKAADDAQSYRVWPPPKQDRGPLMGKPRLSREKSAELLGEAIENLNYRQTKLTAEKDPKLAIFLEERLGIEGYDFGVFNPAILND